jgi:predicted transcriptional regulator
MGIRSTRGIAEAREEVALSLRAKGWTQAQIGKELGIGQPAVNAALVRALAKRRLLTDEELIRRKHEQTMILEQQLEEASVAWERSKQNAETRRVVESTSDSDRIVTTTSTAQCGDPRYIQLICKILADIRAIWGLDASQKAELATRDGDISDEERSARLTAIFNAARARRDRAAGQK